MEYWSGTSYNLEEVSLFTSKDKAEEFMKTYNNADCSCSLFDEEVDIEINFEIV